MSDGNSSSSGGGCGCLGLTITLFFFVALWFGLPTPWGTLDIDIFPPGFYVTGAPSKK